MSDRDALVAACLAHPDEDTPKLVLADYLNDHGDPATGYALRWMVRFGKGPSWNQQQRMWEWYRRGFEDSWHDGNPRTRRMPLVYCWLPAVIGREMPNRFGRTWFVAVKRLGTALERIRSLTEIT